MTMPEAWGQHYKTLGQQVLTEDNEVSNLR